jgi:ABC-type molybdate transport system substrate-binding protein
MRLIEGDAKDSTITFISQNTLVLLFSQKSKASTKDHIQKTVDRLATSNRNFPNLTPSGRWLINVPSNLSDYDEHGNSRHTSPAQRPVAAVGVSRSNIRQKCGAQHTIDPPSVLIMLHECGERGRDMRCAIARENAAFRNPK